LAKFWYRMERFFSEHGRLAQIILLILAGAVQVVIFGMFYSTVWRYEDSVDPRDPERVSALIEGFWAAWTFMSDGGSHAKTFHAEQRIVGAIITVSGIIYTSSVIAFIVDVVRERMDSMRVGKSQVHETGHIVILYWSDVIVPLIYELCIARQHLGGGVIVVLAREPVEVMSTELATQLPSHARFGTKIVCRSGNPILLNDLIKVSADKARAVIILAGALSSDESDSMTLRCIFSLNSMGYKVHGHVVAQVRDVDNEPLLRLVGSSQVETLVSHDVLGRLMLMSVRQLGLSQLYQTMLGFEGNEFYMKHWPELNNVPYSELLSRFPDAIPIGVASQGHLVLNPEADYIMQDGDELIVIAEDESSYKPEIPVCIEGGSPPEAKHRPETAEKILICGWRRDIRDMLKLLDIVLTHRSEVHMMTHCVPVDRRNAMLLDEGLDVCQLRNITLVHHEGNTSVRRKLEQLPLETYSSCIIFADQTFEEDSMRADSHSLATLVLIRDIQATRIRRRGKRMSGLLKARETACPISCEVLDSRTQLTIMEQDQLRVLSNFVQSNQLVAKMLAMIGQERSVKVVMDELLGARGSSLRIVPAYAYVYQGERVSFWTLAKRVASHRATLIGYQDRSVHRHTILNPPDKNDKRNWGNHDLAIIDNEKQKQRDGEQHPIRPSTKSQDAPRAVAAVSSPSDGHRPAFVMENSVRQLLSFDKTVVDHDGSGSYGVRSPTTSAHGAIDAGEADSIPLETQENLVEQSLSSVADIVLRHCTIMGEAKRKEFGTNLSQLAAAVSQEAELRDERQVYSPSSSPVRSRVSRATSRSP